MSIKTDLIKDYKKVLVSMPKKLHQQIIKKQYDIFQNENKNVSVAYLIRSAIETCYGNN